MENPTNPNDPIAKFDYQTGYGTKVNLGLSKREHFAAIAMQGILASRELQFAILADYTGDMDNAFAEEAVNQADLLIKALNK